MLSYALTRPAVPDFTLCIRWQSPCMHLPVIPAQLMRPGIGRKWVTLHNICRPAFFQRDVYFIDCLCLHSCRPKWVKCNGEVYRSSAFLLTGWQEDNLPAFSSIQDIIVVDKNLFLIVCKFTTVRIDRHFHSFVVSKVGAQQLTTLDQLVDTHPLYGHYVRGNSLVYITMRSHVQNT